MDIRNKPKTEVLEKILKEGFEDLNVEVSPHCELYGKGNERLIYDTQFDRIVLKYKVEEK